ncbi:MAG: ATP-binding protein, partial [Synergistaceae bacterium]|nr:ATP-binding protein [Synergistaceae bacterium]
MKPSVYIAVLLVNVLVFACIGAAYIAYTRSYGKKLFDENINNVENLNAASANAASTYIKSMGVKIDDVVNYIEASGMDVKEAVWYLGEANTDPDKQFQLVLSGYYGETDKLSYGDFSGTSIRKIKNADGSTETYQKKIVYGSAYYDIRRSFTNINDETMHDSGFVPEFTDPDTKQKCFAVYRHIILKDTDGRKKLYTVLLAVNSPKALNSYKMQDTYSGQSTVLFNEAGNYIIKNSDYRNANFYDYIVNYNGLTLDQRQQIRQSVLDAAASDRQITNLFYKNHKGVDCVFSVAAMNNGWYSVTCVPISSFFSHEDEGFNYSLIILLLFLALFAFDGAVIYYVGKIMNYNVAVAELATEEAIRANQAKSLFLSTMSHELRTPLNAIIGFAALSADSVDDPPTLRDYLKKIDISSKLLLQLISDILDVSAIESGKLKINEGEFDIAKLITALSVIYYDQCAAKGIEFSVVLKNIHSETLVGDSVRVNQILLNFLSNAVKFTPSGGSVTLRVETMRREGAAVVIRFDVVDTGCGISDELKTRLFEPFERAEGDAARKYSGTGLGLSIARNLAKLMKGRVGVESKEGEGSRFWVELPFAAPPDTKRRSFSPIVGLRVAAAINNADEREYIGQILSNLGVQHGLADSADAALALLREEKDGEKPFNLCMLDWKMPDLNAVDATKKI